MQKIKLDKFVYERYLTDKGFPEEELKKLKLRKTTHYGRWLRLNDKEKFEEGYREWKRKKAL